MADRLCYAKGSLEECEIQFEKKKTICKILFLLVPTECSYFASLIESEMTVFEGTPAYFIVLVTHFNKFKRASAFRQRTRMGVLSWRRLE